MISNPHTKGSAILIIVILFLFVSLTILLTVSGLFISEARALRNFERSRLSLITSESALEDIIHRLSTGKDVSSSNSYSLNNSTAVVTQSIDGDEIVLHSSSDNQSVIRNVEARLIAGEGVAFFYGVQSDNGGFILENSSSVIGNVFSNGTIVGADNYIYGTAISAGPGGLIRGVRTTYDAYANTIDDSIIGGNAFYQTISDSTVNGNSYPGSPDIQTTSMPIDEEVIEEWKAAALAEGIITEPCPYVVSTAVTLDPVKISCDVVVAQGGDLTLTGPIWISGNLTTQNTNTIRTGAGVGSQSIAIVVDNESNRLTSSQIAIRNSTLFTTSTTSSQFLLISRNNSAANNGSEYAIEMANSSAAGRVILYAAEGEIRIQNNSELRGVTAYKIRLRNSAEVIYETGLVSLLFSSGPSGGYTLTRWIEVE